MHMTKFTRLSEVLATGWCQYYEASNIQGMGVVPNSPRAVSWCIGGAAQRLMRDSPSWDPLQFLNHLFKRLNPTRTPGMSVYITLIAYNDAQGRTQAEVVALIKEVEAEIEAIAKANIPSKQEALQ